MPQGGSSKPINFNEIVKKANLKDLGNGQWQSPAGLIYGTDRKFGNRVYHLLAHSEPDLSGKTIHSIFACQKHEILPLVDEAWTLRMTSSPIQQGIRTVYTVPMGRVVGTAGETNIRLVIEGNQIITAFPLKN